MILGQAERLRVLWLIKGLGAGGAELLLSMIAEVRDTEKFDYEVAYLLPWKDALVGDLRRKGVAVHCLEGGKEWNLSWAVRLRRLLARERYDIVHVHSPYVAGLARLAIRTLPKTRRPRIISTEHLPWAGHVVATRILNGATFALDDAHVAVSHAVRESIPSLLRRRTRVVVHGIFVERVREQMRFREEARSELGVRPETVVVGTVANLRPNKGYPVLLKAAGVLLAKGLPVRFVAIGQGHLEQEVRRMHRSLGLGDGFVLMGYREDATRLMAAFDVFVLTSLYEGLPLAVMEAFSLGLPVVASAIPGIREEIQDGREGILVPPGRPEAFAEALSELVRDPERRALMSKEARERAGAFDIRIAARRIEDLYREVAVR